MLLLLIRHAIAEDREAFAQTGQDDALRPLTLVGRQQMRQGVEGLRSIVRHLDMLVSSPLVRARETADIVLAEYAMAEMTVDASLVPGTRPGRFIEWLQSVEGEQVAAVGHAPDLPELISCLVTGSNGRWIELRKGGICGVRFKGAIQEGKGVLQWLFTPAQLRQLCP